MSQGLFRRSDPGEKEGHKTTNLCLSSMSSPSTTTSSDYGLYHHPFTPTTLAYVSACPAFFFTVPLPCFDLALLTPMRRGGVVLLCREHKRARKMAGGDDGVWNLAIYIPERAEFLYQVYP